MDKNQWFLFFFVFLFIFFQVSLSPVSLFFRYPIASQPPGLCLIFHMMEDRPGADEDLKLVKDLFENVLKYDVVTKVDPKAEQIKFIISKLKAARNKFYDRSVGDR